MAKKHDVIIVGMGLASLATAARLWELGVKDIGIYTTAYGGTPFIAAINFVLPDNPYNDTTEQYNDDMIHAGYGINNRRLVKEMTDSTMEGYNLLRRWGVEFASNADGTTKLRHLSGHTYPRSLCCTTQLIGVEMVKKLVDGLEEKGIPVHMNHECLHVLTEDGHVCGITVKIRMEILKMCMLPLWWQAGEALGTCLVFPPIRVTLRGIPLPLQKRPEPSWWILNSWNMSPWW